MSYNLLLLSDAHLFGSRGKELFGVNCYQSLRKLTEHIRCTEDVFDLTIALGDLSEEGSRAAYEEFHDLTGDLAPSGVWMPGNHDRFGNLPADLSERYVHPYWNAGPWHIIFIDTTLDGRDEGEIGEEERDRLLAFLESHPGDPLLIFMHHQPRDVGSSFIDALGLKNKSAFWDIVSPHPQVRGIVFGHVHQVIDEEINGIRLLSVPATSMQFKPNSRDLEFDALQAGYRTMRLFRNGSFETRIGRISEH